MKRRVLHADQGRLFLCNLLSFLRFGIFREHSLPKSCYVYHKWRGRIVPFRDPLGSGMPPSRQTSELPDRIGSYAVLGRIADGGMGSVVKARNDSNGQLVAIKLMYREMTDNPIMIKRFEQEFRAASKIEHPNVVRALDYGEWEGIPYLVMEFVDGEPLSKVIEKESPMGEVEGLKLIAQVAQGLHRAHKQNLVHRDVKPDNILITRERMARITDLGLVKEQQGDLDLTRTGRGLGTPHFMAPEQFRNAKNATVRCDIYSLGATLYSMLTRVTPFKLASPLDAWMRKIHNEFTPPREINPKISERVDWAIRRAMSADPMLRPGSCREFIEDLTGRSTRKSTAPAGGTVDKETWYLTWRDEDDKFHSVMGTIGAVRRSLKEGLLGDARSVKAGRKKEGPYLFLQEIPEFRDLILAISTGESSDRETQPDVSSAITPQTISTGSGSEWTRKSKKVAQKQPPWRQILIVGSILLVAAVVVGGVLIYAFSG